MIARFIAPEWAIKQGLFPSAFEGDYEMDQILKFNSNGYNCYYFPNTVSDYSLIPMNEKGTRRRPVQARDIDVFSYCFVDLDLKDYKTSDPERSHDYASKQDFIDVLLAFNLPPSAIVDSGGGVHAYWAVDEMDAKSFLRLNRRLCRVFKTDPAVIKLNQLMRIPGTLNVKNIDNVNMCEVVHSSESVYTMEQLNASLPPITPEDEEYCNRHYDTAYNLNTVKQDVGESIPEAFVKLCRLNKKVEELFNSNSSDRSLTDFKLGLVMFNNGITKKDALTVLYFSDKASSRSPEHRYNYANGIVEKIWTDEAMKSKPAKNSIPKTMEEILAGEDNDSMSPHFPCHPMVDATAHGFRLSHVLGLIGGSGNGKTSTALNMLAWFTEYNVNKDYIHIYVSLEMKPREIAEIWKKISSELTSKSPSVPYLTSVRIVSNYEDDGTFKNLSLEEIRQIILNTEKETGKKVGCVVIDHIGILRQEKGPGEFSGVEKNCRMLKSFAVSTKTFLIVQSQTSRAKNGGGDIELDMDAAFGTSSFEHYSDWIMTTWQPLKRVLEDAPHMTVQAFKFAKLRAKNVLLDRIKADVPYGMMFDPNTLCLNPMTEEQMKMYDHWNKRATNIRNKDKKREPAPVRATKWVVEVKEHSGKSNNN